MQCFGRKQMQDMNRHVPWVMKDPRMALLMPQWRPLIKDLVCVFVHKDPIKNAVSLASNGKKSSQSGVLKQIVLVPACIATHQQLLVRPINIAYARH